jgi:RNA polymerase sigma-70 factor, ECF subfamily
MNVVATAIPLGAPTQARKSALDVNATYQNHAAAAHRLALRILHDRELAADAVQEAFLSLWLLRERYADSRNDVQGLLRTLVQRRAVDIIRQRSAGPPTTALAGAEHLSDDRHDVHEQAVGALYAARVRAAITSLAPARREVLLLSFVQGHTQNQIATSLGIPIGTVKSRLARARTDLKRLLPREIAPDW